MTQLLPFVSCHSRQKGQWSAWTDTASVPAFSAGLQFGISVFEGMQAHVFADQREFKIQFLADHYERLCRSAAVLGIDVPDAATFEAGLKLAIDPLSGAAFIAPDHRIYLRTLHFSGCEDIFPRSDYPFFCSIFARAVPKPTRPAQLSILADRPYIRAVPGSGIGAAKCAANYTQMVELDRFGRGPASVQRLWVSPERGHWIEELDTMAIGLIMDDGTYSVPPPSMSKLPSITMKKLLQKLSQDGHAIEERALSVDTLALQLKSGAVTGIFAASTGKGLGLAAEIQIGERLYEVCSPPEAVEALWRSYSGIHETPSA